MPSYTAVDIDEDDDWLIAEKLMYRHILSSEAKPEIKALQPYSEEDLNKLAYWNATGSGKTYILHINILQYQYL